MTKARTKRRQPRDRLRPWEREAMWAARRAGFWLLFISDRMEVFDRRSGWMVLQFWPRTGHLAYRGRDDHCRSWQQALEMAKRLTPERSAPSRSDA